MAATIHQTLCENCGAEFTGLQSTARFCGQKCRQTAFRTRKRGGRPAVGRSSGRRPRRAIPCGDPSRPFFSGPRPDLSGLFAYVIAIRAGDDPERSPRSARKGQESAVVRGLRAATVEGWREKLAALFADGIPRTFNRATVEIADWTADFALGEAPEEAIWTLVEDRVLEFQAEAPVLFRAIRRTGS